MFLGRPSGKREDHVWGFRPSSVSSFRVHYLQDDGSYDDVHGALKASLWLGPTWGAIITGGSLAFYSHRFEFLSEPLKFKNKIPFLTLDNVY